jgi:hypothetical protein
LNYFENPEELSEKLKISLFQCFRKTKGILRMIECLRKVIYDGNGKKLKVNKNTDNLLGAIHAQFSEKVKDYYFSCVFIFDENKNEKKPFTKKHYSYIFNLYCINTKKKIR